MRGFRAASVGRQIMVGSLQSAIDMRARQRFGISVPLTVMIGQREIPGFTRDLSNRGVYFYLDQADSELIGREFEFLVELPPEITLSTCCLIRGQGRVVRMDHTSSQYAGIAAEILHYSMQRDPADRD
jgi:hypothetical protein